MTTFQSLILVGHTIVALLIIVLVLLQRGKGADAGAAFGSGASGTVFGARGSSNFFSRATAVMATVFFVSSLGLAYLSSQSSDGPDSLLENAPPVIEEPADDAVDADDLPELDSAPMPVPTEEPSADELPVLDAPTEEAVPEESPER